MASWAENCAILSTWQYKHLIAYWKSKAKALEYENQVLHDIIKKNKLFTKPLSTSSVISYSEEDQSDSETDDYQSEEEEFESEYDQSESYDEQSESEEKRSDSDEEEYDSQENYDSEDIQLTAVDPKYNIEENIGVSDEFIEFLVQNEKHKESVRQEKEKYRKERGIENEDERIARMEAPPEKIEETNSYKDIYGDHWERICALELSLECEWADLSQRHKATYWPNIPLNLS